MKLLLTVLLCIVNLGVDAITLVQRDDPSVLSLPFTRAIGLPASKFRRRGTLQSPLNNVQSIYTIQLYLGTPPQETNVILNTGSSDLTVETFSSNLCSSEPTVCTSHGAYLANSSATYEYTNSNFQANYRAGVGATGDYALDILKAGDAVLQNMQFGIMYTTTLPQGILGLGFTQNELQAITHTHIYDNFPVLLVKQGYIPSRAYSIYLDDNHWSGGQILFGGVDTAKYVGDLVTLNLVPRTGGTTIVDFSVQLDDIFMTDPNGNKVVLPGFSGYPIVAALDSGTPHLILPHTIASAIFNVLNADLSNPPYAFVDCSLSSALYTLDFVFDGIKISVALDQLITPNGQSSACPLNIEATTTDSAILGVAFMSSAYVVFDLDNQQVSIAAIKFHATTSNILEIAPGPNHIPGAHLPSNVQSSSAISYSSSSMVISSSSSTPIVTSSPVPSSVSIIISSSLTTSVISRSTSPISSSILSSKSSIAASTTSSSVQSSYVTSSTSSSSTLPNPSPTAWIGTPVIGTTINLWQYLGCVSDTAPRVLDSASHSDKKMDIETCQEFCTSRNYGLAGLENGKNCYCGNSLSNIGAVEATNCSKSCVGNSLERCGGAHSLSLFRLTTFVNPSHPQSVGGYEYQGCYNEPKRGRVLSGPNYKDTTGMTVESCVAFCASQTPPQKYAGVEYSKQCFCSNSILATARSQDPSVCNLLCTGDKKEFCGASSFVDVYLALQISTPQKKEALPVRRTSMEFDG